MRYKIICVECNKSFDSSWGHTKVCSTECRRARGIKQSGRYSPDKLSTGTVGAISEMEVAIELMRRGYAVFRALSPACECDLIALKDGKTIKVEVKTGYQSLGGKINFPISLPNHGKQDWYAVFLRGERVIKFFDGNKKEICPD